MGLTNIQFSSSIDHIAGRPMASPALINGSNTHVVLNGQDFDPEEVEVLKRFICCFAYYRDRWLRFDSQDHLVPGPADDHVRIPALRTVDALRWKDDADLAYIILVRGNNAALATKTRVLHSRPAVLSAIYEEAVNGYHVVFSAAMLKADVGQLDQYPASQRGRNIRVVRKKEDLQNVTESADGFIYLWC